MSTEALAKNMFDVKINESRNHFHPKKQNSLINLF